MVISVKIFILWCLTLKSQLFGGHLEFEGKSNKCTFKCLDPNRVRNHYALAYRLQMCPSVIFCLFLVKRAPNSKILSHFGYIFDPLSIKINDEMGEMLL